MSTYHYRTSVTTDPETITFSSLGSSLEGRTIPTIPDSTSKPVVIVQDEDSTGSFRVSSVNSSGGSWVSFTVDASDVSEDLPIAVVVSITTFEISPSVSNAKTSTNGRVRRILKDTGSTDALKMLLDTELNERIDDAAHIYSDDKPRVLSRNIIGDSENDYDLSSDWQANFSTIKQIEYPGGESNPQYLEDRDWFIYEPDDTQYTIASASSGASSVTLSTVGEAVYFKDGDVVEVGDDDATQSIRVGTDGVITTGVVTFKSGETLSNTYDSNQYVKLKRVLRLPNYAPQSSEFIRVEFNARHIHTDSQDTIPTTDYEAFTHLCAALAAESIANKFRTSTESSYPSDSVGHLDQASLWSDAAGKHRDIYNNHIGKGNEPQRAVMAQIDIDTNYQSGNDFLMHPRRGWDR